MRFVLRRLGFFIVTLWAAVTLNFLIPRLMPGNAAIAMMGRYKGHVNPEALHALQVAFGVNAHQSLGSAYLTYLGNIGRGHFGISLTFFPDTVAHQVQVEDMEVCEQVQRGLKSRSYSTGRFSVKREAGGYQFHRLLAERLQQAERGRARPA